MRARRIWASVAAVGMAVGVVVAGAGPASAASADPSSLTINCRLDSNGIGDQTFIGEVGDTFTLTNSSPAENFYCRLTTGLGSVVTVTGDGNGVGNGYITPINSETVTIVASGSVTITYGSGFAYSSTITIVVGRAESSEAPPIPAWVQAYGRASADAKCEDGWDASWQSWAEPVTGGWVCTRSIPSFG